MRQTSCWLAAACCAAVWLLGAGLPGSVQAQIGKEWQLRSPLPTPESLQGVAWTGTRFVAVGDAGTIFTSNNGNSWAYQKLAKDDFQSVAWSGTVLLAVLDRQDHQQTVWTSSDGLSWTAHTASLPDNGNGSSFLRRVIWTGTQWAGVATHYDNGTQNNIDLLVTSADGLSWTKFGYLPTPTSQHFRGINAMAWTGTRFICVGYDQDNSQGNQQGMIISTADGTAWDAGSPSSSQSNFSVRDVVWTGSQAVAVDDTGGIYTSPDGIAWTKRDEATGYTNSQFYSLMWTGAKLFALGQNVQSSEDGVTWTMEDQMGPWANHAVWSGSVTPPGAMQRLVPTASSGWEPKPNLLFARADAAVAAMTGILYVAGGSTTTDTNTFQSYNPATDSWTTLPPMPGGRYQGAGAQEIGGKLYVIGGWTSSPGLPHSELFMYDPQTLTWSTKASLPTLSGCGNSGVINGKLYVTTPCDGYSGYRNFFSVYDPATNSWTGRAATPIVHVQAAAGVISGKLYLAGGFDGTNPTGRLDAYDPVSNTWTQLATMPTPRFGGSGAVIDGKLHVIGGYANGTTFANVDIYDPTSNTWSTGTPLSAPRASLGAGVINGGIYAVGGRLTGGVLTGKVERYTSSVSSNWEPQPAMPLARAEPAVGVVNNKLYVAGGWNGTDTNTLQSFDPTINLWTTLAPMPGGRYQGDGAQEIGGLLYVIGGWTTSPGLPHSELFAFNPANNSWSTKAPMPTLSGGGASGVISGKLYVTTPYNGFSGFTTFLHVYDPATNAWTALPNSPSVHASPAGGVISGKLYVAGGNDNSGNPTNRLDVYDPVANAWSTLTDMPTSRYGAASAVVGGKLYVIGGRDSTTTFATVEVYDPVANTWAAGTSLPYPQSSIAAGVINGAIYIVGGRGGEGSKAVGVGYGGVISSSTTGQHWTQAQPNGPTSEFVAIMKVSSNYVAFDRWGTVQISTDLANWTGNQIVPSSSSYTSDAIWNGSKFVAVGEGFVATSTNGTSWTNNTSTFISNERLNAIAFAAGQFVTIGGNNSNAHIIATSPDAVTWTRRSLTTATPSLNNVAYIGTQWIAVGDQGTIITSPTGVTWTKRTSGTTQSLHGLCASGSTIVAVGDSGVVLTSTNAGLTWVKRASRENQEYQRLKSVMHAGTSPTGNFIALGEGSNQGLGSIMTSPDGIVWTDQDPETHVWFTDAIWDTNQVVAIGNAGMVRTADATPRVQFAQVAQTVLESDGTVSITVQLGFGSSSTITVPITVSGSASNATDFTGASVPALITFNPNQVLKTISIPLINDSTIEGDETIILTLGTPTNGKLGAQIVHTVTIQDEDSSPTATFVKASASASEAAGTVGVEVVLSWAPSMTTTVPIIFEPTGSTADGSDGSFTPSTLTFDPGMRSQMLSITINNDNEAEPDETLVLGFGTMTNAHTGAIPFCTLTIKDNDPSTQLGRQWAARNPLPMPEAMHDIAWTGSLLVVVGNHGMVMTSGDGGITWARRYTCTDTSINAITSLASPFGSGVLAVGDRGHFGTSPDGIVWSDHVLPGAEDVDFTSVLQVGGELFIAGGRNDWESGSSLPVLYHSTNGIDWTERPLPATARGYGYSMVFTGTQFVMTGGSNDDDQIKSPLLLTSPDGLVWTDRSSAITPGTVFNQVLFSGSKLYAFYNNVRVFTSTNDGVTWTNTTVGSGTNGALAAAASKNATTIVAVGDDIATTTNTGTTWTQKASGTPSTLRRIIWLGGDAYAAIGGTSTVLTTTDNVTWTKRSSGIDLGANDPEQWGFLGVAWNGSVFVAVGGAVPGVAMAATSPDGVNWTQRTVPGTAPLMSVAWSGTQFVAVGFHGLIRTSPDGITWTARTSGTLLNLRDVTWAAGQFIVCGGNEVGDDDFDLGPPGSTVLTSPNGITWTRRTIPTASPLTGIFFDGTTFFATGMFGALLTSADAITWITHNSGIDDTDLRALAWNGTTYVCSTFDHRIFTSTNGLNWTAAASVPPAAAHAMEPDSEDGNLHTVVWTGSMFVVVGGFGHLYTSPDGQTWTAQESGTRNNLFGLCWNGSMLVATGMNGTIVSSGVNAPPVPTVEFAETASTTKEGTSAKVLVTLSTPPTAAVTVPFSITYGTAVLADITPPLSPLIFNKGETSKYISVLLKSDASDEADEDFTLTLLTPTGASLGLPATQTHVLTIEDDDTLPVIAPQPAHDLIAVGSPLLLSSGATGSGTVALQWKKKNVGASTFVNVSGATFPLFYKAVAALTDAGTYKLVATNAAGSTSSTEVEVGVYDGSYRSYALADGTLTANFTQAANGNGLSFSWVDENDVALILSPPHLTTNATGNVLTLSGVVPGDAQLYKCQVGQAASSLLFNAGRFNLEVVTAKATWTTFTLPPGQVGFAYATNVATSASTGAVFTASGLPAGLTIDPLGNITGVPTAAATNKPVIITATNAKGISSVNTTITIAAIPPGFVTGFHGLVARDADVNGGLGSRIEFNIPTSGIVTGKLFTGNTPTKSFTGPILFASATSASAAFTTAAVAGRALTIAVDFDLVGSDVIATGTVGEGPASEPPPNTANFSAYRVTTASLDFKGYYTYALILPVASQGDPAVPQGHGYGMLTVSTTGATTIAGKVGDGSAYSTSSFVGTGLAANEGQFILYSSLYAGKGTLHGTGKLTRAGVTPTWLDNEVQAGGVDVTWNKKPDTSPAGARNYPDGWTPLTLTIAGSKYTAPATGQRVMNLPNGSGSPNASLEFFEGGLSDTPPGPDMDIEFKPSGLFTLAPHSRGTTFSMTPANGGFKGTFVMSDFMPNGVKLARTVNYEGLMVRYNEASVWTFIGVGWFLMPQLPSADISPMPLPTTTPILAGHVFLSP